MRLTRSSTGTDSRPAVVPLRPPVGHTPAALARYLSGRAATRGAGQVAVRALIAVTLAVVMLGLLLGAMLAALLAAQERRP